MRMAEFVDEKDNRRIAVSPDHAVLYEAEMGVLVYTGNPSPSGGDTYLITATYEEALAELNSALCESVPQVIEYMVKRGDDE